ncbi:ABC transporter substrate-binding protein [Cohnella sp.]|uniref:ABC transporter substrate-binding protein n=1 Tax=Cohnella sp. TaxID=1883426 RepID=UPI0035699943
MNQEKTNRIPFRDLHFTMIGICYRTIACGQFNEQQMDAHTLLLITKGQGMLQLNGTPIRLLRGKSLVLLPETSIEIRHDGEEHLCFYVLTFEIFQTGECGGIIKTALCETLGLLNCKGITGTSLYRLEDSMKEILQHVNELDEREQFVNQFRFQTLMYYMMERNLYQTTNSDTKSAVEQTIQHMHHHYHEVINVDQLAQMANMSRRWYTFLFKEMTGKSPTDYLTGLRIGRAKEMLHIAGSSLYDIARHVGFQDEHYLSRRFKQTVGQSPRQYVRNRRHLGTSITYPELLYSLGVTPIAAPNKHDDFPSYLKEPFKDVLRLDDMSTPNFEMIRSARPDFILAPAWKDKQNYEALSRIAPTVLLPEREDWRDELRDMGEVLGKKSQAEQVIQAYDLKLAFAKERLRAIVGGESVIYMRITRGESVLFGEHSTRGKLIHQELGLKPAKALQKSKSGIALTTENLSLLNADHIFLHLDQQENSARERYEEWLKSAQWNELTVVKRKQVYLVGNKEWYNFSFSPVATNYAIDDIIRRLERRKGISR